MTVYIEIAILENLCMDGLIGIFTLKTLRLGVKWRRVWLSAAVGTVCALLYPLLVLPTWAVLLVKLGIAVPMLLALPRRHTGLRKRIMLAFVFFGYTFLLGGVSFGVQYFVSGDIAAAARGGVSLPVGALLGAAVALTFGVYKAAVAVGRARAGERVTATVIYLNGKKTHKIPTFLDTGNRLFDPVTGFPVVVVKASALAPLFPDGALERYVLTKRLGEVKTRVLAYATVAGEGSMPVFTPDKLVIYSDKHAHILYDISVGVAFAPFSRDADALYHPAA
jgi:stage II sporulation protein GA (sporulation sigma-E factor processing peptidase)